MRKADDEEAPVCSRSPHSRQREEVLSNLARPFESQNSAMAEEWPSPEEEAPGSPLAASPRAFSPDRRSALAAAPSSAAVCFCISSDSSDSGNEANVERRPSASCHPARASKRRLSPIVVADSGDDSDCAAAPLLREDARKVCEVKEETTLATRAAEAQGTAAGLLDSSSVFDGRTQREAAETTLEEEADFPDVYQLFQEYDACFFEGRLAPVELRWSSRMTLCAGLCVYKVRKQRNPHPRRKNSSRLSAQSRSLLRTSEGRPLFHSSFRAAAQIPVL